MNRQAENGPEAGRERNEGRMKTISRNLLLLAMLCGCTDPGNSKSFAPDSIRAKIIAASPAGWDSIQRTDNQGMFDDFFKGSSANTLVLLGPGRNYVAWQEAGNIEIHKEHVARECLCFWIVPVDFHPAFPFFDPCGPKDYPKRIYSSSDGAVYAVVSHHITDKDKARLRDLTSGANHIWSGPKDFTWKDWEKSLHVALNK